MRISKVLADTIATKLCEKKYQAYESSEKIVKETTYKIYKKKVPKDIMTFFTKHPKMVKCTSYITIALSNYKYFSINLYEKLPDLSCIMNDNQIFTQSEKESLYTMQEKSKDLLKEYKEVKKEVELALLNLNTTKRIAENFPEAIPFLPTSEKYEIAIDLTQIRKKLK